MFFEKSLLNFSVLTVLCAPGRGTLCQFCSSCCWVSFPCQGCRECKCASWWLLCIHLVSWSAIKWTVCCNAVLETWIFCPVSHLYKCNAWAWSRYGVVNWIRELKSMLSKFKNASMLCFRCSVFLCLMMVKIPWNTALALWSVLTISHTCMSPSATGVGCTRYFSRHLLTVGGVSQTDSALERPAWVKLGSDHFNSPLECCRQKELLFKDRYVRACFPTSGYHFRGCHLKTGEIRRG